MQTILGSNGQIGQEIAKEIFINYTKDIRLVGRKPKKIHDTDELVAADLMKYEDSLKAVEDIKNREGRLIYNLNKRFLAKSLIRGSVSQVMSI